jgi:epoxide hydrolase 4
MLDHLHIPVADGIRLHGVAQGMGQLVLFLHGFPEFSGAWHRQLAEFSGTHRAAALDLRGYHLSDKPHGVHAYELRYIVSDICAALRALSPQTPAVVVGHDWGGVAAWMVAHEAPELLDRLIIINAPHPRLYLRELKRSPAQWLSSSYAGFFQLRGVAERTLRAFGFAALRRMIFGTSVRPENFPPKLRKGYLYAWQQPYALNAGLHYYRTPRKLARYVSERATAPIQVPTLVLWGEKDPSLRLSNLRGLEQLVSTLEIKRHPSATHWIAHEEPAWVNTAIRGFIAS